MCGADEFSPPVEVVEQVKLANLAALYDTKDVNPVCIAPGCECRVRPGG